MNIPTIEILPHIRRQDKDGNYAVLVGRVLNYATYPNIGVLFVKKGVVSGVLFVTFDNQQQMRYVEDEKDVAELERLWSASKEAETLIERMSKE